MTLARKASTAAFLALLMSPIAQADSFSYGKSLGSVGNFMDISQVSSCCDDRGRFHV